ncbi:hypothetical protein DLM75_19205 [Leptospira stimsonii]|uniref:Uncharacterized protein n=1 Tax=Leptospira stimsonii TaxID=2202203 RepID=A0A396YWY9_9LEPT|nr:hypothetical protein DLM75_19205 [Leptospira stimsonii]
MIGNFKKDSGRINLKCELNSALCQDREISFFHGRRLEPPRATRSCQTFALQMNVPFHEFQNADSRFPKGRLRLNFE